MSAMFQGPLNLTCPGKPAAVKATGLSGAQLRRESFWRRGNVVNDPGLGWGGTVIQLLIIRVILQLNILWYISYGSKVTKENPREKNERTGCYIW